MLKELDINEETLNKSIKQGLAIRSPLPDDRVPPPSGAGAQLTLASRPKPTDSVGSSIGPQSNQPKRKRSPENEGASKRQAHEPRARSLGHPLRNPVLRTTASIHSRSIY